MNTDSRDGRGRSCRGDGFTDGHPLQSAQRSACDRGVPMRAAGNGTLMGQRCSALENGWVLSLVQLHNGP
jgi:hypothetical protein